MENRAVILRLEVQGFGEAKSDLQFLTTETEKLNTVKRQQQTESRAAARAITAEEGSMEKLRAETALLRQQANQMRVTNEQEAKARDQVIKKIQDNTKAIRDHDRAMSGSSTLVGEYEKGFTASFAKIGTAMTELIAGFAAARGAIKLFTDMMNSADTSGTALEATIAAAKAGVDNFFKSLAAGDFESFIGNLGRAVRAGKEFVEVMDALQDANRALGIEEADAKVRMAELEMIIRDESEKSAEAYEKRRQAAEEYLTIAKALAVKKQILVDEEFAAYTKKMKGISQLSEEQLDAFMRQDEETKKMIETGREYTRLTKEMRKAASNQLMGIYEELRQRRNALGAGAKAYSEAVKDYDKLTDDEKDMFLSLYEKKKAAEYSWFTESKRIYTKLGTLRQQEQTERAKETEEIKKQAEATAKVREEVEKYAFTYAHMLKDIEYRFDPDAIQEVFSEPLFSDEEWEAGMQKSREAFAKEQEERNARRAQYREEDLAEEKKHQEQIAEFAQSALRGVQMASDAIFQNKKARLDAEMQAELNNQNLTEQQKEVIRKKYAREQQKIDIKQALINTALGIGNALATVKPFVPAALIAAGLAAVQGGIQVAAIKAQKFARGGRIRGGVRITPDRTGDDTLIVAKQGEVILNERHQKMLGGASTFKKLGVPGFAAGGIVGEITPSAGVYGNDMSVLVDKIIQGFNDKKVILHLPELKRAENDYETITKSSVL